MTQGALIGYLGELGQHGYRTVLDGSAVIVISGEGRSSRARRYESVQVAYNTLVKGSDDGSER